MFKSTSRKLIIFAGTVGAGKSTHLLLLRSQLIKEGISVKITFLKTTNLVAYIFLKAIAYCLKFKAPSQVPLITALNESFPILFKRLSFVFVLIDVLSIVVKDLFCVRLPLKLRKTVLVEEYLPATILDYLIMLRVRKVISRRSFCIIYKFAALLCASLSMRTQIVTFFFDAPNHILFKRYQTRKFKERKLYLEAQRKLLPNLYLRLLNANLIPISSSDSVSKVQHLIRGKVRELLLHEVKA